MKTSMSSFDLMAIAKELLTLVGGRFDKAFQTKDEISIRLSSKELGKKEIFWKGGVWIFLRNPKRSEGQPGTFAMVLRKHLSNARLVSAQQHDFDRVLVLEFEKRGRLQLIFELFGKGNAILVKEGKIVSPLRRESWSTREIRIGEEYKFPPSHHDPRTISLEDFESIISDSERDLVRTLALDLNLGGRYSEELCLRAGIDKDSQAAGLSKDQIARVYEELHRILKEVKDRERPNIVFQKGEICDVAPIPLRQYSELESRKFETMSQALEFLVSSQEKEEIEDDAIARLERRIRKQGEALKESVEKERRYREIADLIVSNVPSFEKLVEELRMGKSDSPLVKSINHKRGTAKLSVPEGKEFTIDYRKSVFENASTFYDKAKREKAKRERLKKAIADSREEMRKAVARMGEKERFERIEPTKRFWFDAYRWFISSEGHLVIAGRDARSNDRVVKRHLKSGDRYAHAEIKGAPSVVVKDGSKATDATLREACEFALSFSKAWNMRATGNAYWVKPEQVSKRPESGEFLPKGAFMVRGNRNYFRDLELEVAVGEIQYRDSRKIMCGPRSAVECQSKRVVILRPGETRKEMVAKELSQFFNVPVDEIVSILPPGGFEIVEKRREK
ncbi:MAG: ribosome rescue protein RqcH [Thermoplasmata archaeon]